MRSNGYEKVMVIGAGLMGPGIACRAAMAGHQVILIDREEELVKKGLALAEKHIGELVGGGIITRREGDNAVERLRTGTSAEEHCGNADLIIEAITENVDIKRSLFKDLDAWSSPECLIVSNTSGLSITEIGRDVIHKNRIATTHFWFPAHLVPLVEIVMGDGTSEETAQTLKSILSSWGKAPVIVRKDLPGQLANRILQAVIREALNIVQSGLASAEDVDTAIKNGPGLRFPVWGPLEHIDAVGLDLALSVQNGVLPGLNNDVRAPEILQQLVDDGQKGYKTGCGVYDWSIKDMDALAADRDSFIMDILKRKGK